MKTKFNFKNLSVEDQERYRELSKVIATGKPVVHEPTMKDVVEEDLFVLHKYYLDDEQAYEQARKEYFDKGANKQNYAIALESWKRGEGAEQYAKLHKYLDAQAELKELRKKAVA